MEEKEFCIRCGKPTPYDQSTPITVRRYFVEGAGQLCAECFAKVYGVPGALDNRMGSSEEDKENKEDN